VRKVLELGQHPEPVVLDGLPVVQNLLRPTRIYVRAVRAVLDTVPVKAMAHITGGGIPENLPRSLPGNLCAKLTRADWLEPEIFQWLATVGGVDRQEMDRAFNCGIGYTMCVPAESVAETLAILAEHSVAATQIGVITERTGDNPQVRYV
jgi:phosphoribosylformylglycinamidine cyclo-ligase